MGNGRWCFIIFGNRWLVDGYLAWVCLLLRTLLDGTLRYQRILRLVHWLVGWLVRNLQSDRKLELKLQGLYITAYW